MKKNIIITGIPRSGKSTLLQKIVETLPDKYGVITHEIKKGNSRIGFSMSCSEVKNEDSLPSEFGEQIAHINYESDFIVSKYGVNVDAIDKIANRLLNHERIITSKNLHRELNMRNNTQDEFQGGISKETMFYIDEIGQMQLFSFPFRDLIYQFLDSENKCIMTMSMVYNSPLIKEITTRDDVQLFHLNVNNRSEIENEIKELLFGKITKNPSFCSRVRDFFFV